MITNMTSVRRNWSGALALAIMTVFIGSQSAKAAITDVNTTVHFGTPSAAASAKRASAKRAALKKSYKKKKYTKRKKLRKSVKTSSKRKYIKRKSKRVSKKRFTKRKYAKRSYKRRYARKSNKRRKSARRHGRGSLMATLKSVKPAGLPLRLAAAVVTVESGWRVNARGSSGERGLMQLMPATARMMGARGNLYNPRVNMRAGTKYLNWCYRRARKNVAATIGCYNRGPAKMWAWSKNRITRRYVGKVRRYMGRS